MRAVAVTFLSHREISGGLAVACHRAQAHAHPHPPTHTEVMYTAGTLLTGSTLACATAPAASFFMNTTCPSLLRSWLCTRSSARTGARRWHTTGRRTQPSSTCRWGAQTCTGRVCSLDGNTSRLARRSSVLQQLFGVGCADAPMRTRLLLKVPWRQQLIISALQCCDAAVTFGR